MSTNWNTSERGAAAQERRRLFQKNKPSRFCPRCTALAYITDDHCFECGITRPGEGWPALEHSGDAWLGHSIEDRYLITKHLATSQSARIYRADSRIIPRSFAIKVMNVTGGPDLDQKGLRHRLQRELEALSSLRNPHIVSFYDVVELEDDQLAFVMDLIDGLTLDDFVAREGPLSVSRVMRLLRQLANGVYEAHASGLIHHDLKPSNIMIEKLPAGDDFVRILDFGVVWVRGASETVDSSTAFSSPEQLRGETADHRADIYSIGALAFLMLTGRPPFDRRPTSDLVQRVLEQEPPALEDIVGHEFPASVEAFVARLLAKDPDRRPANLNAVIERLDDIIKALAFESFPEFTSDERPFPPEITSPGVIPTLGDASSPVLMLDASSMAEVSEIAVVNPPLVMACDGPRYAFFRGNAVVWADVGCPKEVDWESEVEVCDMAVANDFALFARDDGSVVRVWRDGRTSEMYRASDGAAMTAVVTDNHGTRVVAGSDTGRLYTYKVGGEWQQIGGDGSPITALGLSAKGDQFAVARGTEVQILRASATRAPNLPLPVSGDILSVAFSSDDYLVAILVTGGTVVLASVITGQEFMRLELGDTNLRDLTFSQDNHIMGLFRDGTRVVLRTLT